MEFIFYFGDVFTPINFALLLVGTIGGLVLGATPGLSPTMAVALLIACGGLVGLAVLTTNRRRREIGIRKALGASVPRIVLLLSKQVLLLVAGAFAVAVPLGWLAMDAWLEQFAYRVELGAGTMALAGFGVVVLSWLAVSWKTIQAARTNPVTSLRSE